MERRAKQLRGLKMEGQIGFPFSSRENWKIKEKHSDKAL
jgi:hypothetical protein